MVINGHKRSSMLIKPYTVLVLSPFLSLTCPCLVPFLSLSCPFLVPFLSLSCPCLVQNFKRKDLDWHYNQRGHHHHHQNHHHPINKTTKVSNNSEFWREGPGFIIIYNLLSNKPHPIHYQQNFLKVWPYDSSSLTVQISKGRNILCFIKSLRPFHFSQNPLISSLTLKHCSSFYFFLFSSTSSQGRERNHWVSC